MKRRWLTFSAPGRVAVSEGPAPVPAADHVLVRTRYSAVSAGTEMLVYRGQWPEGVAVDATLEALAGPFAYPLKYGYCAVGRVVDQGGAISEDWLGRRVFAFHPHQNLFCARPDHLHPVPDDLDDESALFLPNMETAVNLVLDGRPLIGEKVIVVGQGVVGLLTTALLSRFPLSALTALDCHPLRRDAARRFGADACLDPADPAGDVRLGARSEKIGAADLVYELSGNPAGLDHAIALTRYSGRVVVGSWFGAKRVNLDLGASFHRGRISLISSQVSRIAPGLTGRWSPARRMDLAWEMLRRVRPADCITHRFGLADAASAYALIDRKPEETIQVIFEYGSTDEK